MKPIDIVLSDKDACVGHEGLTSLSHVIFLKRLIKKGEINIRFKMRYSNYKNRSFQEIFDLIWQRILVELFKEFTL